MSEMSPSTARALMPSDRKGRPVIAYFKLSDACSVGCDHCYLPLSVRQSKYRMSDETLEQSINAVRDMVERQRAPGAVIIWHGGEPLALPPHHLEAASMQVRAAMPDAIQSIQTSLIPYRSQWAPLIREAFDGHIGTSIDFSQRKIRGSVERYHELFLSKVAAARAEGFSITPGVVPSKGELGRGAEIVRWMQDNDFLAWNIDRYNSFSGPDPMRPLNREHSEFLSEVFDAVMDLARAGVIMKVNTVQAALSGVLMNQPGDRWGGSCSRDFLVINPDGATNACPDKISFEGFSNVRDGFDGFESSEARKAWVRAHLVGHRNPDCPRCPFNTFCRSGCPLTPNAPEAEGECSGYHRHLRHVRDFAAAEPVLARQYLTA